MSLKVYGSLPPAGSLCQRLPGYGRRKEGARPTHRNDFSPSEKMRGSPGSSHGSHFSPHRETPCTAFSPPKKAASPTLPAPEPLHHPSCTQLQTCSNLCSCTSAEHAQRLSAGFKQKTHFFGPFLGRAPPPHQGQRDGRCQAPLAGSHGAQDGGTGTRRSSGAPKASPAKPALDTSSPHLRAFRAIQGVSYTHLLQPTVDSTRFGARIPPGFHLEKNIWSPLHVPVQQTRQERCQDAEAFGSGVPALPACTAAHAVHAAAREGGHAPASQRFSAGISGN